MSLLKPVFLRLGHAGLKWEPPKWADPKKDYCNEYVRFVAIFGAGDCHAPERNVRLKNDRLLVVRDVWPEEFAHLLWISSEAEQSAYEARFGEFPAGTNATKEARAGNRGVVLLEMIDRRKRDPKQTERERAFLRSEVQADFEELFKAAQERVGHSVFQCMLQKVQFKDGLPVAVLAR